MDTHQGRLIRLDAIAPRIGTRPTPQELAILHEHKAERAEARGITDDATGQPIAPELRAKAEQLHREADEQELHVGQAAINAAQEADHETKAA